MAYGFLVIWNPDLDQCKIFYVAEGISCLAISPDNNIVTGSDEGLLQLLDHRTGECRAVFKGHSKKINCIATLSNGDLASGSDDGTLRLWDSKTGKCKYILNGRFSRVTCIAALTDDKVAMGADSYYRDNRYDDVLKIWDINTGKCLYTLQGHGSAITFIYSLYNGTILVGSNNKVLIWNINTGECKQIIEFDEYIKSATQLSSGNLLCLGRKNLWIWHFPLTKLQQVDEAAKNNLQP
jgi:WD40 repeat protein